MYNRQFIRDKSAGRKKLTKKKCGLVNIHVFCEKTNKKNDLGNRCIQKVGIYFYRINISKKNKKNTKRSF